MTNMNEGEPKELLLFQSVLNQVRQDVLADNATLAVPDADPQFIRVFVSAMEPSHELWRSRFALREGVAGEVAATKRALIINDVESVSRFRRLGQRTIGSIMAAPIEECGKLRGVLTVTSARANAFTDRSLELLTRSLPVAGATLALAERAAWGAHLAALAHDISSPVSSIRCVFQMLTEKSGTISRQQLAQLLQIAGLAADQLSHLVEDMHDGLSLAARGVHLDVGQFDIVSALHTTVASLQLLAHEAKVRLHFHSADQALTFHGDRHRIDRIVMNLTQNALKFTPEGRDVTVSLQLFDQHTVAIVVEDEGPGISPAVIPQLFDLGFMGMTSPKYAGKSHGFGLAIARELARAHDGDLRVTNRPEGGARFVLLLPLAGPSSADSVAYPSAAAWMPSEELDSDIDTVDIAEETVAAL